MFSSSAVVLSGAFYESVVGCLLWVSCEMFTLSQLLDFYFGSAVGCLFWVSCGMFTLSQLWDVYRESAVECLLWVNCGIFTLSQLWDFTLSQLWDVYFEPAVGCLLSILIGASSKVITPTTFILLKLWKFFELSDLKVMYTWCLDNFINISFIFVKLFISQSNRIS